jgi:hypothetical protein
MLHTECPVTVCQYFQDVIPDVIPSQKYYMNVGPGARPCDADIKSPVHSAGYELFEWKEPLEKT